MKAKSPLDVGSIIVPSAILSKDGVHQNTVMTLDVTVHYLSDGRRRLMIKSLVGDAAILLDKEQSHHIARLLMAD